MSIEEAYDAWAEHYDTNDNKTRDLDAKVTIETLSKYAFKNVLELGCGTGKNTSWLLNKAEQIIGLDFSSEMLNAAKQKITDNRVQFKLADLTENWAIENAEEKGFELLEIKEWFDDKAGKDIPRLISFVFKKKN